MPKKAEYWAVIWGTLVMGLTGLMIWFKLGLFSFLARGWIDIALAIHFYEVSSCNTCYYHLAFLSRYFRSGRLSAKLGSG